MSDTPEVRVATAVGVSSNATLSGDDGLADRVEKAMSDAVRQCLEEGVVDPEEHRSRMLAARAAVLAE